MRVRNPAPVLLSGVVVFSLFTGACATKKFVRNTVSPVQNQVNDVAKQAQENKTAIGDLDRNVARVDEKAMEADKKAVAAGQAAQQANQAAQQAQNTASEAQQGVEKATQQIASVDQKFNNLDNYKLTSTEKVYFGFDRATLTKEEQAKLDQAVQSLQNAKNYVIEIEGFTDSTGSRAYNLDLARRRAEAVVRYLTVEHGIPLRKIHDLGVGSQFPNADNSSREARKENRRVDVRVYALDISGAGSSAESAPGSGSTGTANRQQ